MMSQSEYNHTIYQARKNSHLCIQCGKQDAFTLNGRARCAECTAAERERDKKRYQKSGKERNRKAYQDRLEKGVCGVGKSFSQCFMNRRIIYTK